MEHLPPTDQLLPLQDIEHSMNGATVTCIVSNSVGVSRAAHTLSVECESGAAD